MRTSSGHGALLDDASAAQTAHSIDHVRGQYVLNDPPINLLIASLFGGLAIHLAPTTRSPPVSC